MVDLAVEVDVAVEVDKSKAPSKILHLPPAAEPWRDARMRSDGRAPIN